MHYIRHKMAKFEGYSYFTSKVTFLSYIFVHPGLCPFKSVKSKSDIKSSWFFPNSQFTRKNGISGTFETKFSIETLNFKVISSRPQSITYLEFAKVKSFTLLPRILAPPSISPCVFIRVISTCAYIPSISINYYSQHFRLRLFGPASTWFHWIMSRRYRFRKVGNRLLWLDMTKMVVDLQKIFIKSFKSWFDIEQEISTTKYQRHLAV